MNQVTEISNRAKIIAQISSSVYFNIPEEFGEGPENMMKNLEKYDNQGLSDILDGLTLAAQKPSNIAGLQAYIRDDVHSLLQARLLIVAEISMNRRLIEKIVQKSNKSKN